MRLPWRRRMHFERSVERKARGTIDLTTSGRAPDDGMSATDAKGPMSLAEARPDDSESDVSGDDESDPRLVQILSGRLTDIPPVTSKIVRIFTSSTFTDTQLERNSLMASVYPKIKETLREKHGLEFQVVDMRWGVRDEATDDHMTTELCMNEIHNCQRLSLGPNFIVLLGQKYGYRPIPTYIPGAEFDMLREIIKEDKDDVDIMDKWYKKDENAVPEERVLQPISSILFNFCNKRHQKLQEQDQNTWWEIMGRLQTMLRKAAQSLMTAGQFNQEQMHHYFMSVTEREVRNGVINVENTKDHCFAYVRHIENINLNAIRFARNYIDMNGREVDKEAERLMATLRDERLPESIEPENLKKLQLEWAGKEGMEMGTHRQYLADFCSHFYNMLTGMVDKAVEANKPLSDERFYKEILQHSNACARLRENFLGRQTEVETVRKYLTGDSYEPLIIFGESGCGKTSVLAKCYELIDEWLNSTISYQLLRFLGTSPDSSTIIPLLTSLCEQIAVNFGESREDIPDELSKLNTHFRKMLSLATEQKPLIVFLDSLDSLSSANGAHQLAWVPAHLPPHTKFLVTCLPGPRLETLRRIIPNTECYLEIPALGEELGHKVLMNLLAKKKRTVSRPQRKLVDEALSRCNLPLFVKLVYEEVRGWRSYSNAKNTSLKLTIHESIHKLFDRVEQQHGKILVSHALGYLTASKSGLSEAELEDLLSLDEKVLNDVYQYHLPPTRRIPPLLWTRIRNDLPNYLNEREADGVVVINWYHLQFMEAARERYFRNINFLNELHSNIADYFLGIWGGKPKPFEYSELQRQRFCLDDVKGSCDRKVPEQPLWFTNPQGKVTRFNLRKLSELPFHLVRSKRYQDMNEEVLFNVKWLYAKLASNPLQSVLADFEDSLNSQADKEVKLLMDALRLSASILSHDPQMVGSQIIGRLLPLYNTHSKIGQLIKQCDTEGLVINALVPAFHCMHTPGGPLQYSLEGHPFAPFGIGITSDAKHLVSVSSIFIIWELSTADVFRQVNPAIQGIMEQLCISRDDKYAIAYTNNSHIVICSILTGEFKVLTDVIDDGNIVLGLSLSPSIIGVWTFKKWYLISLSGEPMGSFEITGESTMLCHMEISDDQEIFIVERSNKDIPGITQEIAMNLKVFSKSGEKTTEDLAVHSALALTTDKNTLFACNDPGNYSVTRFTRQNGLWKAQETLSVNDERIFALVLSGDAKYLCGVAALSFMLWDVRQDNLVELKLPLGVRNIPKKNQLSTSLMYSRDSQFLICSVRKCIYVFDIKAGVLMKTLDAHFARIIALVAVNKINKVISASIDKSIKVWNFENIQEDVHSIDRHDKAIESILISDSSLVCATVTRSGVGIWKLETGKLQHTLANNAHGAIVTDACLSVDGTTLVTVESGKLLIWGVEAARVGFAEEVHDVQQLLLFDRDTKCLLVSKDVNDSETMLVMSREVPSGQALYQFSFHTRKWKNVVVTSNRTYLVVPAFVKNNDVLSVYHSKTGSHMYDIVPKYNDFMEWSTLIAMPHDSHNVALIDMEKGNIIDIRKKSHIRSVLRWNGVCNRVGRVGLFAPMRGGLEMIELKRGQTIHTLIPRVAEGVHQVSTLFTGNDAHVAYYHSGRRSIRVFRCLDGKSIADYKGHAEIRSIASTPNGAVLLLGAVDGSLVQLVVADPERQENVDFIQKLPSRQLVEQTEKGESCARDGGAVSFMGVAHAVRLSNLAMKEARSTACLLS